MQITDEAHQMMMSEALTRTLLNPITRPGDLDAMVELGNRLGGEDFDIGTLGTHPVAGSLAMAVTKQYLTGTLTADVSAAEIGLTVDEYADYSTRSAVSLNELPLLCQVAAAYGLRMDIVFTPEV